MNKLDDADDIAFVKAQITRIRPLAYEMRQWPEHNTRDPHQYPWNDVADCMFKYPRQVKFDYDLCPDCHQPRLRIFYNSSDWAWKHLCGICGWMVICAESKKQAEFKIWIRS